MTVLRRVSQVASPVLLGLLLCADVAFLLLHVSNVVFFLLRGSGRLPPYNPLFSLATDGGYPEVFQYVKEYWIVIVLVIVCWRTREGIYATWALFFTYLLCDDALGIHETVGEAIAAHWKYVAALGLLPKDFGELAFWAIVGSAFLMLITYFYVRGSDSAKDVSRDVVVLLGVLILFAVLIDMVHSAFREGPVRGLTILEDGGEMITMSSVRFAASGTLGA